MPRVPKGHYTRRGVYPERHPLKVPGGQRRLRVQLGQGGEGAHPMGDFGDGGDMGSSRGVMVGEGVVIPGGEP